MEADRSDAEHVSVAAADERERTADKREKRFSVWADRLERQARRLGQMTSGNRQSSFEAIKRARGLLEASLERLDRSEGALRRANARDKRDQRTVERETAVSKRQLTSAEPVPGEDLEAKARRLNRRLAATVSTLDATLGALVDAYERLALERPQHAAEYRGRAERARQATANLRDTELTGDQDSG
ncbi:hypothetical protein ACIBL8_29000 [Streptomyces sp. NPDC050523]|uniref:hypothetical protein n=1 Tax=Streptomyces sp. NPDC050523 TaxID=3365622 RepID=UPI0037B8C2E8